MLLYLDTNVILTRYAPEEPRHGEAKKLLGLIEGGELAAVTSVLALVEVVSTISRVYNRFNKATSFKRSEVAGAFLRRVLEMRNLDFIPMGGEVTIKLKGRSVKLPVLFAIGLEIGSKTGVKTLDNLHLAAAYIAPRIYGHKIDYFVTLDGDLLKHRRELKDLMEIEVVTPAEISE